MDLVIVFIVLCIIAWLRKPLASLSRLHGQTRAAVAAALAAIGTAAFRAWRRDGQPQVVLRVAGLDDLLAIADQASAGWPAGQGLISIFEMPARYPLAWSRSNRAGSKSAGEEMPSHHSIWPWSSWRGLASVLSNSE